MNPVNIAVIGSLNMDLVTRSPRFPAAGETIMGVDFQRYMGGKGANQAVAAARLGARVSMIGAVGNDDFGREMTANLQREGVNTDGVKVLDAVHSGLANITVADGENTIIVVAGANFGLTPADIVAQEAVIAAADVVLAQLEIPLDCVMAAARLAQKHGKPFILNPAPAQPLPSELLDCVTLLTPNAYELAISLNLPQNLPPQDLMTRTPCPVVMTVGSKGALYHDKQGRLKQAEGFKVSAVDTTGAGDTFNGALAVFWHEGMASAVRKACAAGALSVTKAGAQGGMPTLAALEGFLSGKEVV
ncbi:ribokinase [Neisseria perflava]|uniref:ribokinase n=1 Tax=Neisseria perflava TaxID=33053 RepID=UPI0020A0AAA0|nr:ribokinase [Neisseria perflava]MCP1659406.1 ribokinase [Neisseria perflava]MCP1772151.1 ribokinase [Neisseria perflava]